MATTLGEFEQIVLLATLRLGESAYAVSIRDEIAACTRRQPSISALHTTLNRLQEKGLVTSRFGDPTPRRGGRSKRYFKVNDKGLRTVAAAQRAYQDLLDGVTLPEVQHA